MNLVIFGPPGSGKGTQAVRLANKFRLEHLSTGDTLREAVKNKTALGNEADSYMLKGELVPDKVLIGLIENCLSDGQLGGGFILDGFPRTIPQAESLKKMLQRRELSLDRAILLEVDDEEIVKRLSGRWFCPRCNAGYNYPLQIPATEGKCDKDGADLQRRPDDEESVVRNRLEVYKKQTAPIVEFYRNESILAPIAGHSSPDNVFNAIVSVVGDLNVN